MKGFHLEKNAKTGPERSRQWVLFFLWEGPNPTDKLIIPSLKPAPRHFGELTSGYSIPFYKFMEDIRREDHLRMYQTYRCILGYHGYKYKILKSNWYMDVFQHHNYSPHTLSFFFKKNAGPPSLHPLQTEPGLHFASESLNYGDAKGSSFRFGHPKFLEALAGAVFFG